jgi:hypothetical protein
MGFYVEEASVKYIFGVKCQKYTSHVPRPRQFPQILYKPFYIKKRIWYTFDVNDFIRLPTGGLPGNRNFMEKQCNTHI